MQVNPEKPPSEGHRQRVSLPPWAASEEIPLTAWDPGCGVG